MEVAHYKSASRPVKPIYAGSLYLGTMWLSNFQPNIWSFPKMLSLMFTTRMHKTPFFPLFPNEIKCIYCWNLSYFSTELLQETTFLLGLIKTHVTKLKCSKLNIANSYGKKKMLCIYYIGY